jgi:hypothetical protein
MSDEEEEEDDAGGLGADLGKRSMAASQSTDIHAEEEEEEAPDFQRQVSCYLLSLWNMLFAWFPVLCLGAYEMLSVTSCSVTSTVSVKPRVRQSLRCANRLIVNALV